MRMPNAEHRARPWRIHELTGDFRLEDVWVLPGRGGPDDLPRAVDLVMSYNGRLGEAYMAAIRPFRHRIVYPAMFREFGRRFEAALPA